MKCYLAPSGGKMIDVCNNFDKYQIRCGQLKKPVVKGYVLDTYWSPDFHEDQRTLMWIAKRR